MLTVIRIETSRAFEALETEWNRLLSESEIDNIFLTYEWLHTWWQIFGSDHQLYILIIRQSDAIIGIAPLMLTVTAHLEIKNRIIRFIGTPNSDYSDFIGKDKKVIWKQVQSYLEKHGNDWTKVELNQIPESSSTISVVRDTAGNFKMHSRIVPGDICMSFAYEGADSERPKFELERSKNFRNSTHFFARLNGLTFERYSDPEGIKKHLVGLFHGHIMRWSKTPTPSKFCDPRHREFYERLADRLAPLGKVALAVLRHGSLPLAYLFAYKHNEVVNLYTILHEPFYERKSPGIIIFHFLTESYIREGYDLIDFARGAGSHKVKFINHTSYNHRIQLFRRRFDYQLTSFAAKLKSLRFVKKMAANQSLQDLKLRFLEYYRANGLKIVISRLLEKAFRLILDYRTMEVYAAENRQLVEPELIPGLTIEKLVPSDIECIAAFYGFAEGSPKHNAINERFADGGECVIGIYKENIAFMSWNLFKKDWLPDLERGYFINENEVLISDVFTSPIYRRMGLGMMILSRVANELLRKNLRLMAICQRGNRASNEMFRKLGFTHTTSIHSLRIFTIRIF